MNPIHKCSCCGRQYTAEEWGQLPSLGRTDFDGIVVEYRNCSCNGTMCIIVPESVAA